MAVTITPWCPTLAAMSKTAPSLWAQAVGAHAASMTNDT